MQRQDHPSGHSPFISVITPTLNVSATIRHSIESVLSQTFTDFEYLVMDGGSEDGTEQTVKAYDKVTWVSEPDRGIYDAMNKGIAIAKGTWVYFLGADDRLYDDEVFSDVFKYAGENNTDIIYGDAHFLVKDFIHGGAYDPVRITQSNICHQAMFVKRSLFERLGNFDLKYPINADWEFNLRAFGRNDVHTAYLPRTIVHYNNRGESGTHLDQAFLADRRNLIMKHYSLSRLTAYLRFIAKQRIGIG
ncbi:MAG: glycosyltransferase [Flavobacteriales bacterium]|nr:glycosyltransferase [Flavobacteriales bacterium]